MMSRRSYKVPGNRSRQTARPFTWMVLIGSDAGRQATVESPGYPDEGWVRRLLNIDSATPLLIGRP